eukprot:9449357-Lingulodinium_polyedra.AAC.1
MAEVCALAFSPSTALSLDALRTEISTVATEVFSGFGQTKVVEDVLNPLRDHSDRDSKHGRLRLVRQYCLMRDQGLLQMHRRTEVTDPSGDVAPTPLP